jgi:hypothetical protein
MEPVQKGKALGLILLVWAMQRIPARATRCMAAVRVLFTNIDHSNQPNNMPKPHNNADIGGLNQQKGGSIHTPLGIKETTSEPGLLGLSPWPKDSDEIEASDDPP